jgi:hypothetical protein
MWLDNPTKVLLGEEEGRQKRRKRPMQPAKRNHVKAREGILASRHRKGVDRQTTPPPHLDEGAGRPRRGRLKRLRLQVQIEVMLHQAKN